MDRPKESDWKTFRRRVPEWRERYLEKQNRQLAAILSDGQQSPTESFWTAEKRMKKIAQILIDCLDRHSRSHMAMSLFQMHKYEMIDDEDLGEFGTELKEQILRMVKALR